MKTEDSSIYSRDKAAGSLNQNSSRLLERMSKEEREIYLNFQMRIQSSSQVSNVDLKSEVTRKVEHEFTDQQPLTREWSNGAIQIPEQLSQVQQKVGQSASSNSLGQYSLGRQPAKVL